ncbi:MAG: hypothetical protein BroJett011_76370 [Chloroflexota bacterium]|nr:MAG: hypothetical protein BroJett011_76370 [Chloroflexota bacterium]
MYPSDEWLETLQFYLIVASGGRLTLDDFSDARLLAAWQEQPSMTYPALVPVAEKLVLEFQAEAQDTKAKNSPIGEIEEFLANGPVSVPMLGVPGDV